MVTAQPPIDVTPRMDATWFRIYNHLLYLPYHALFTLGFSLRLQGKRNMLQSGPALVLANHQSYLDPLLIGLAAHRPLVYLARKTLFRNRYFAAVIRLMNAVPIDQDGIGKEGIRTIMDQLNLGKGVVIFPEGARTPDGQMHPLKAGVHLLIKRTGVPIVPVGIAGAYDAWPIWRKYPIPAPLGLPAGKGTISVSLGKPFPSQPIAAMPREEALRVLYDKIHAEVVKAEALRRRT